MSEATDKWQVYGYDTFSNERYRILPQHEFETEAAARQAVKDKLAEIERDQPSAESGDPDESCSIQDTVILVHPDGTDEAFNTNHLLAAAKLSRKFDEEQCKTKDSLADVMQFFSHDTSKTRWQLAQALRQRAEVIEIEAGLDHAFKRTTEIPSAEEAAAKILTGRIVEKRIPWIFWPFVVILQFFGKKQSRAWHWAPLSEFVPDKAPYGMVGVGHDTKAKPRTGWWGNFYQTNFGWKKIVILRPKDWLDNYRIGFQTVENGKLKVECCEMQLQGAVTCLVGSSDTDFFAVIKRNGEFDFTPLDLVDVTRKDRLPESVPLV